MSDEARLIIAGPEWADRYREFCQKVYQATYTKDELGITSELFSKESFSDEGTIEYFRGLFSNGAKVWLLIGKSDEIIGGIVANKKAGYCEMKGLYIDPSYQGQGYGKRLFNKVIEFAEAQPIQIEVIQYMQKTIDLYKRWGFELDSSRDLVSYPIQGWPEAALRHYRGVVMIRQP